MLSERDEKLERVGEEGVSTPAFQNKGIVTLWHRDCH